MIVAALEYLGGSGLPRRNDSDRVLSRRRSSLRRDYSARGLVTEPQEQRDVQPDRSEELDRWVGR